MSMAWVRNHYGVPAKRGRLVEVYYRPLGWGLLPKGDPCRWRLAKRGRIGSASRYIHVDGVPFHPTQGVVYLDDDGTVLMDTRKAAGGAS